MTRQAWQTFLAACALAGFLVVAGDARSAGTSESPGAATVAIFDIRLTHRHPSGWKVGHEQQNDRALIREYVPAGQSVHDWREMITLQVFRNLALNPKAAPAEFLGRLANLMRRTCPEAVLIQPLGPQTIGSASGETAIIGCRQVAQNQVSGLRRGQGELAVYLIFRAHNHLILLHRAARGPAFEAANAPIHPGNSLVLLKSMAPLRICPISSPDCR